MFDQDRADEHDPEQDELAHDIKRAFAAYRAPVHDFAASRRRRPRFDRPRLLALSGTAAVAVVLVVTAILVRSLAEPASAYASWTPVPSSPNPALALVANEHCRPQLTDPSLPLVAQDQRGEVAMAFFSDGRSYASCLVTSNAEGGWTAAAGGDFEGMRTGALRLVSALAYESEDPVRMVIGDVSPEVASVIIVRDDGEPVSATVTEGYFLAWWPTAGEVVTITAFDQPGNELGSLEGDVFD